ncbi:hypothetical protein [Rheinheimera soli]|uniref:Uncharacterized protein n=1 Tax=Rheinheimera soli TaxID=443616 RepID=A0ABU1W1X9_9GAMM|nr:hypothetical protein [Rheinheimera soli]MDR7121845.1 hypothetical protein [Rheinheimera soli]
MAVKFFLAFQPLDLSLHTFCFSYATSDFNWGTGQDLTPVLTWLGRFDRLAQNDVLKKDNILLPLQGPTQANTKLAGAFKEVEREFAQCGLHTIRHNDTKAITAFAKQALTADGFHLTH